MLPEELLLHILILTDSPKTVLTASLVSRQWRRVCLDPLLWKHLTKRKWQRRHHVEQNPNFCLEYRRRLSWAMWVPGLEQGFPQKYLTVSSHALHCIVYLGGRYAAVGAHSGTVTLFVLDDTIEPLHLKGHAGEVYSLALLSPTLIASGSADNTLRIWNVKEYLQDPHSKRCSERNCLNVTTPPIGGIPSSLCSDQRKLLSYSLSAHSDRVVSGGQEGPIIVWDVDRCKSLSILIGHTADVGAVVLDGDILVSGGDDFLVNLWDTRMRELVRVIGQHNGTVRAVTYDPVSKRVITASSDYTLRTWDLRSSSKEYTASTMLRGQPFSLLVDWESDTVIAGLSFGNVFVSVGWRERVGLSTDTFSIREKQPCLVQPAHSDGVTGMAFTERGFVSCSWDSKVWACEHDAAL